MKARSDTTPTVGGWRELVSWPGASPTFADASVQDFHLSLTGDASLVLRTFAMPDGANYDPGRPVIVTVSMNGVETVNLVEFAATAVLDELKFKRSGLSWRVSIEAAYGFHGSLIARNVSVASHPG